MTLRSKSIWFLLIVLLFYISIIILLHCRGLVFYANTWIRSQFWFGRLIWFDLIMLLPRNIIQIGNNIVTKITTWSLLLSFMRICFITYFKFFSKTRTITGNWNTQKLQTLSSFLTNFLGMSISSDWKLTCSYSFHHFWAKGNRMKTSDEIIHDVCIEDYSKF